MMGKKFLFWLIFILILIGVGVGLYFLWGSDGGVIGGGSSVPQPPALPS